MLFSDTLSTALKGLQGNRTRSLLTMLGVIIGVGSVVLMVSVGTSFKGYILTQIESFGGNTIDVFPTGFEKFGQTLDSVTVEDYESVRRLSTVKSVAPVIFIEEKVIHGTEEITPMVFGSTEEIFANYGFTIEHGRLLTESDTQSAKAVIVLAHEAANDLFGSADPIGDRVTIGARQFTVVGVLKSVGSLLLQDLDKTVFVPYTIARAITGQKYLDYISLQAAADDELTRIDIISLLRQRHKIDNPDGDPDKDDFQVRSAAQAADVVSQVTLGITLFLGIVAGISLLVGGIGIMNIMLVAVTERTKEIGLRKAVGARRQDILLQFLLEAIALTVTGGMIGIVGSTILGFLLSAIANRFLGEFGFAFSFLAIFLALLMAIGTGVVFGLYPARKAAALSPMEAMRWE
ncbi:MAG TPA: ABC transporter permease [Candidatus Peribacterales bacterium]|nr:ABC transporter permease [Candidatus Peribacterales bacterium]